MNWKRVEDEAVDPDQKVLIMVQWKWGGWSIESASKFQPDSAYTKNGHHVTHWIDLTEIPPPKD